VDAVIQLGEAGGLTPEENSARLGPVVVVPTTDVTTAVLSRSFRGIVYGTGKLWFQGASGQRWSTWLVTKKARQPLQRVLGTVLGDRFEDRLGERGDR